MKMKIPRLSFILLFAVFLSALPGCAGNPAPQDKELMFLSEEQEVDIGKELYRNAIWAVEGGGGEYRDEGLKAYLKDIVLRVQRISERPGLSFDVAVQNTSLPNAWAIPGYVVITRGLLAALDSEAEFVFIVGHEMAHVSANHSARQMTYGMLQQIRFAAAETGAWDEGYSAAALSAGAVGGATALLKYTKQQELEADGMAISYMRHLGYDTAGAVSACRKFEAARRDYIESSAADDEKASIETLFAAHPRASAGTGEIERMIQERGPYKLTADAAEGERFKEMLLELRAVNSIYAGYYDRAVRAAGKDLREAEALALDAADKDKGQPAFLSLMGFMMLKKKDYEGAERHFTSALKLNADYQPALKGIGTLHYLKGSYLDALVFLHRAFSVFPEDMNTSYFLGMSLYKGKICSRAVQYLNPFAEAYPMHTEIHGVLGVCYENLKDTSAAYDEYLLQLKVSPGGEMGKHAASRAAALREKLIRH
ncbi:MAG: M48 family metalloprotease [Thermodesulfovibrionales bacterium]|nr:M48 family metalloprotease [Thermodesulfovibrionales bacterium]